MPQVLLEALIICAIYLTMILFSQLTVFCMMKAPSGDLIEQHCGPMCRIVDSLPRIQALIVVPIVQPFGGDIQQRAIAEQAEFILTHSAE